MLKHPLELQLKPRTIEPGQHWLSLRLNNVGMENLTGLDVRLNSLDDYSLTVLGTGKFVSRLQPEEKELLPFQVSASRTGQVYVSVDGWKGGVKFHWESPEMEITIGGEPAELSSLFAVTEPYSVVGDKIMMEATLKGLEENQGLTLEFWADTPRGAFEELAVIETKPLSPGELAAYSAEIVAAEEGLYTLYAYLYEGVRRIGRKVEYVYVQEA